MGLQYAVRPDSPGKFTVSKWEDSAAPTAVYTVSPGPRGFLECSCPSRKTCKHIQLVVRYIRGDQQLFYDLGPIIKKPAPVFTTSKESEIYASRLAQQQGSASGNKKVLQHNLSIVIEFGIIPRESDKR